MQYINNVILTFKSPKSTTRPGITKNIILKEPVSVFGKLQQSFEIVLGTGKLKRKDCFNAPL